ncbi:MAG: autotransporter outer membrane beta-barrel domain-containing protein [Pseudomonadota bacterium]
MKGESRRRTIRRGISVAIGLAISAGALAQSADPGPGLTDSRLVFANAVERAAAAANQATFEALDSVCNPGGVFDSVAAPDAVLRPDGCTDLQFFVYFTTRELVHSANELLGEGSTVSSLGVDQRGLGTALRWTAAEELAVQGSMATQFSSNQLSNFATRISALRQGARGFSLTSNWVPDEVYADAMQVAKRLDADPSGGRAVASPWGGFLNVSVSDGEKDPTGNENAFDIDGSEVALGIDYRFANDFVLGVIGTYSDQRVDFNNDTNSRSVVDGGIDAEGTGGLVFGMFNGARWYWASSFGFQSLDYDMQRDIRYPSFNPEVEDSNSTATSSPEASIVNATFDLGYRLGSTRFTVEPYLSIDYLDITVDAFDEARSFNSLSGLIDSDGFNLTIDEQSFRSVDTALGVRFQWTLTPSFGVVIPYVTTEYHYEFEDEGRVIRARYSGAGNEAFTFAVPTDPFDTEYFTWSFGLSTVIRGARQRRAGGPVAGGLSAFTQFQSVERLDNYEERVISAGIRYEF